MTAPIKNIIFDLGNVLIDIDFLRVKNAFEALGVKDFDKHYSQLHTSDLFVQIETGKITDTQFYNAIREEARLELSDNNIQSAWNAILLDFRVESIRFLQSLRKNYRLFLLSNTNAIHLEEINHRLQQQTGVSDLRNLFDKAYFSHEIGLRKPDEKIYTYVTADAGITPQTTVFIDDLAANIKPAHCAGWNTHLLLQHERIEKLSCWV